MNSPTFETNKKSFANTKRQLLYKGEIFDINNMSTCWPYSFLCACEDCGIRMSNIDNHGNVKMFELLPCPVCGKKMIAIQVTEEMFNTWVNSKRNINFHININELLHRAEHEIDYVCKIVIEEFLSHPNYYNNWSLFLSCAAKLFMSEGMIEQCKYLMQEYLIILVSDQNPNTSIPIAAQQVACSHKQSQIINCLCKNAAEKFLSSQSPYDNQETDLCIIDYVRSI